jgi:outer membrane lipoprotein-sorting protein
MKKVITALVLFLTVAPAFGQKPCEELKAEIAKKLEAKGVKNYQLDVVTTEEVKDQKVVGSCEGGKKKIIYKKGDSSHTDKPSK